MALLLTWINFNPHSPCGERLNRCLSNMELFEISIHTPLAGSDSPWRPNAGPLKDFNPHSPCGERLGDVQRVILRRRISIHTPLAGSDLSAQYYPIFDEFQSTLPLRGATLRVRVVRGDRLISIHTPLAGSDVRSNPSTGFPFYFNPHSPCGERLSSSIVFSFHIYFNPHSPCGERHSLISQPHAIP